MLPRQACAGAESKGSSVTDSVLVLAPSSPPVHPGAGLQAAPSLSLLQCKLRTPRGRGETAQHRREQSPRASAVRVPGVGSGLAVSKQKAESAVAVSLSWGGEK